MSMRHDDLSIPERTESGKRSWIKDALRLIRPHQWTKNIYVLAPLIFSKKWMLPEAQLAMGIALACFCLWASGVYCLNDIIDADADRNHPRKKNRPVASGRITKQAAFALAALLISSGFILAHAYLPAGFVIIGALYIANNLAYCLFIKHRVIADVLSIAIGFVLRLEAGCSAIQVMPSSWILVCGFSLALVFGFGKRRLEFANMKEPTSFRRVLYRYTADNLNLFICSSISICLLSYILYTVAPETVARHHTDRLIYTVPFVAYGLFRFLFKVQNGGYDGPEEVLIRDRIFALNVLAWISTAALILYLA